MQLQDLPQPLITTYYDILRTTLNLPPSIVRREEQTEPYSVDQAQATPPLAGRDMCHEIFGPETGKGRVKYRVKAATSSLIL